QEARSIRSQGLKQAQIIQAQADADASKTYAASFGKDPDFYDFYRAMQSYRTTFIGDRGAKPPAGTTIVLSPQNDYLKEFTGRPPRAQDARPGSAAGAPGGAARARAPRQEAPGVAPAGARGAIQRLAGVAVAATRPVLHEYGTGARNGPERELDPLAALDAAVE